MQNYNSDTKEISLTLSPLDPFSPLTNAGSHVVVISPRHLLRNAMQKG